MMLRPRPRRAPSSRQRRSDAPRSISPPYSIISAAIPTHPVPPRPHRRHRRRIEVRRAKAPELGGSRRQQHRRPARPPDRRPALSHRSSGVVARLASRASHITPSTGDRRTAGKRHPKSSHHLDPAPSSPSWRNCAPINCRSSICGSRRLQRQFVQLYQGIGSAFPAVALVLRSVRGQGSIMSRPPRTSLAVWSISGRFGSGKARTVETRARWRAGAKRFCGDALGVLFAYLN